MVVDRGALARIGQPGPPAVYRYTHRAWAPRSVAARRDGGWLRAITAALVVAGVRADGRRNCLAVAACLLRWADWHTDLSRPTWDVIAEQTGLSRRTVARWLRWLQDHDLVVLVQGGTTPRYAPNLLRPGDRNLAAVYQLTMPVERTVTPSRVLNLPGTPARARGKINPEAKATDPPTTVPKEHKRTEERPPGVDWRPSRRALRREWHRQQAVQLQERALALRRISDVHLASIIRPHLAAGHTVEDLVYAIDRRPDGTPHRSTDPVRSPAGWLRWRLDCWRGPDGTVLPSRRQQLLAQADAHRRQCEADLDVIHCRAAMEA